MKRQKKLEMYVWAIALIAGSCVMAGCECFKVVSSPLQERGVGGFLEDNRLRLAINAAWLESSTGKELEQVEMMVHRGKVLLMGVVENDAVRKNAIALAKKVRGVRCIFNEISVGSEGIRQYVEDAAEARKLRAFLFGDSRIYSQNYHVHVANNTVYILGTSQSTEEKSYVLSHARKLRVKRIVPFIENVTYGSSLAS